MFLWKQIKSRVWIKIHTRLFWRTGWDSNPRALADNRISSAARYDHFDTCPYTVVKMQKAHAKYSFAQLQFRIKTL